MVVLGINCATENLGLALIMSDGKVFERSFQGQTIKAEDLTLFLDELLKKANISLDEINKIGLAIGPGAFTGLRLSLVMTKTIALAKKIPLIPISTLEALAFQYQDKNKGKKNIRVIQTACRGDVSTALFSFDLKRLEEDRTIKEKEIADHGEVFLLKDQANDAVAVAELARQQEIKYDQAAILSLVPKYSHEARVNLSARPELQHLKIAKKK